MIMSSCIKSYFDKKFISIELTVRRKVEGREKYKERQYVIWYEGGTPLT